MPLEISRNDIRNMRVDAVVNPTDSFLSGSGGVDKTIHELAGPELDREINNRILQEGKAIITGSYNFSNFKYIIHTCGPMFDVSDEPEEILKSCYRECLLLAKNNNLESVAFPLIASGSFMFPKGRALRIASDTITEFLLDNEMMVYLLVYDKEAFDTANKLYKSIRDYINKDSLIIEPSYIKKKDIKHFVDILYSDEGKDDVSFEPDESFSECLIRMIDEKGYSDPEVYKRANIDRKHFNHIINTTYYRPKKETAVALAIGMRLNKEETDTLLERAGFVLSNSSKFDLIIKYCIDKKIYDIYQINEILFEEDQKTLGC